MCSFAIPATAQRNAAPISATSSSLLYSSSPKRAPKVRFRRLSAPVAWTLCRYRHNIHNADAWIMPRRSHFRARTSQIFERQCGIKLANFLSLIERSNRVLTEAFGTLGKAIGAYADSSKHMGNDFRVSHGQVDGRRLSSPSVTSNCQLPACRPSRSK